VIWTGTLLLPELVVDILNGSDFPSREVNKLSDLVRVQTNTMSNWLVEGKIDLSGDLR
jgi:hypothetical protein